MSDESATAGPPPTADPQDPLPESNWVWRRVFVFIFGGIAMVGVAAVLWMIVSMGNETLRLIGKLGTARDVRALDSSLDVVSGAITSLQSLGFWLIILVMVDRVLYLIAPSAEQAAKMMSTVSAWKAGISTSSTARATSPDGSTAEATKTAGPATAAIPPIVATVQKKWAEYAG